ncbi:hypothetical protein CLJ1_5962 [Pseudomonas paraeruginosa]|nr:hypothetical protein CLJ1_5962 [Pseudomonas aeruginosa]
MQAFLFSRHDTGRDAGAPMSGSSEWPVSGSVAWDRPG